jgi:two-component system, chemotaxis family, protein-glutamate methylesterase/glutaminase
LAKRDIIVVGASAGGVEGLQKLAAKLPADLPAAIFVVLHVSAGGESHLPELLSRAGRLRAAHAKDNEPIKTGRIYVAPPDFHLLILSDHVRLSRDPKENRHRPAIDATLRTAARAYGSRVVGVLLSGALDDGTVGLLAVKRNGGLAMVQDPSEAVFPDMPRNAMRFVDIDHCLGINDIAALLAQLPREEPKVMAATEDEQENADLTEKTTDDFVNTTGHQGTPSAFGCPDCGGVLWQLKNGDWLRYECRVGHAFSPEGLMSAQSEALDNALWSALRALSEKADLAKRLAARSRQSKLDTSAAMWEERARAAEESAEVIHKLLLSGETSDQTETS